MKFIFCLLLASYLTFSARGSHYPWTPKSLGSCSSETNAQRILARINACFNDATLQAESHLDQTLVLMKKVDAFCGSHQRAQKLTMTALEKLYLAISMKIVRLAQIKNISRFEGGLKICANTRKFLGSYIRYSMAAWRMLTLLLNGIDAAVRGRRIRESELMKLGKIAQIVATELSDSAEITKENISRVNEAMLDSNCRTISTNTASHLNRISTDTSEYYDNLLEKYKGLHKQLPQNTDDNVASFDFDLSG